MPKQLAFDNLAAVLEAAGCTFDDVVDVTTFHTDLAAWFRCRSNLARFDACRYAAGLRGFFRGAQTGDWRVQAERYPFSFTLIRKG